MFLLGLAGSLHCVQMCGPLVLSLGMSGCGQGVRPHLAYHGGRVLTYTVLGGLAGWLGAGIATAGAMSGIRNGAAIVGGACLIVIGLALAGTVKAERLVTIGALSPVTKLGGRLLRSKARFATGLALGFLPCGLIYGALVKAMSTATPLAGAVGMAAFGLGTAGPLIGLGAFSSVITSRFRSQKLAAAGLMLMGAFLLWRGLMSVTPGAHLHHH